MQPNSLPHNFIHIPWKPAPYVLPSQKPFGSSDQRMKCWIVSLWVLSHLDQLVLFPINNRTLMWNKTTELVSPRRRSLGWIYIWTLGRFDYSEKATNSTKPAEIVFILPGDWRQKMASQCEQDGLGPLCVAVLVPWAPSLSFSHLWF